MKKALPLLIFLAVFAVFSPALGNGWLNWDDDANFLLNPHYRGLGLSHLRWMFATVSAHYWPVFWLCGAVNHALWGMDPFGYHLTNILIHAASAVLFYHAALRLLPRLGAAFGALLFALHPLRVESVAWASEGSTLLSGLFYLAAILLYLKAQDSGRRGFLAGALAAQLLSLLSKPLGMTLPAALLVLDYYPLRRRAWLEKVPFALLSLAAMALSLYSRSQPGFSWTLEQLPMTYRLAGALYGLAFYLRQTVFPASLLPIYMMPIRFYPLSPPFVLSGVLVSLITAFLVHNARRRPALLAVWLFYVVSVLPVLGFVKSGPWLVADHYTYISCLGFPLLAGAAIARRRWLAVPAAAATLVLAGLSWRQTKVWRDPETFWGYMAANDPTNSIARNFLGEIRARQGRAAEAAVLFKQAVTINPSYAPAFNNLGNLSAGLGRGREAEAYYREALRNAPRDPAVHFNLALALLRRGARAQAGVELREAARLDPEDQEIREAILTFLDEDSRGSAPRRHVRGRASGSPEAPLPP